MEAIAVIGTIVCVALLIIACLKKYNILVTLLVLSFVGYALATLVTGQSVAGEKSDGFMWFDVFEMFNSSITGTFTMMGLLIMTVMAYSDFMTKIKASNMFAGIIAIPLSKIKWKAVVLVVAAELALLIHWVVPSGMGCFMVCMATLFPALLAVGCNPVTSAVTLLLGANTASGRKLSDPSEPFQCWVDCNRCRCFYVVWHRSASDCCSTCCYHQCDLV